VHRGLRGPQRKDDLDGWRKTKRNQRENQKHEDLSIVFDYFFPHIISLSSVALCVL
jgi:hypothetical protein